MKMGMWMHLLFVSILAVFIAVMIVPFDNARGTGDPVDMGGYYETSDDWTVDGLSGMFVYASTTIVVNGNLTVTSGFTLTLINVTLQMNCPDNVTYSITVQSGGTLIIRDIDDNPSTTADSSVITSFTPDGDHRFGFIVEGPNGKIEMKNSELSQCGWEESPANDWRSSGLWIGTDNPVNAPTISGNEIHECVIGVTLFESYSGADISNNDFHDCSYAGLELNRTDDTVVDGNTFTTCGNSGGLSFSLHAFTNNDAQILNNVVDDAQYFPMFLTGQTDMTVSGNIVKDSPGAGASIVMSGLSGTTVVTNNEIYNVSWHGLFVDTLVGLTSVAYINNNSVHDIFNVESSLYTSGVVGMVNQNLGDGRAYIHDNTIYNIDEIGANYDITVGMMVMGGAGHSLQSNTVSDISDIGIQISSDNVTINDCEVYSNGDGDAEWDQDSGIYLWDVENTVIQNSRIYDNYISTAHPYNLQGIMIYQSSNTWIHDTEISGSEINIRGFGDGFNSNDALIENCTITMGPWTDYDFQLDENSDFTTLNSTFDNSTADIIDSESSLTCKWYLHVKVEYMGSGVNGAEVWINDTTSGPDPSVGQPFITQTIDGEPGWVRWLTVTEFVKTSSTMTYCTPHTVNATSGNLRGSAIPNVWRSKEKIIQLNNIPVVLDLQAEGGATSVYRETSIFIQANAQDVEDPENALTPFFEYRVNNSAPWETVYFTGPPIYVGPVPSGYWEIEFSPPADAPLGYYDIRVRVEDTYPSSSDWYPMINDNNMIEVLNNPPVVVNITSTSYALYRGDSAFITVECDDVEDGENSMGVEIQYRSPSGDWSGPDTTLSDPVYSASGWTADFTPKAAPTKDETGWYDFRAQCQDSDGESSGWTYFYDLIEVLNNEPVADDLESGKASLFREIQYTWLFANVTEAEDPESDLTVEFAYYEPGIGWQTSYLNQSSLQYDAQGFWKIRFEPPASAAVGLYNFKVTFTDLDSGSDSLVISGLVEVKNNPPLAHNLLPSDTTIYAGAPDPIYLHVNASDVEDLESELNILAGDDDIQWQFNGPAGGDYSGPWSNKWFGSCTYDIYGEYLKVPWLPSEKAQVGYYGFRTRVTDLDDEKSSPYLVILDTVYVGDPPSPKMSMAMDLEEVHRTQEVVITVNVSDTIDPENEMIPYMEYKRVGTTIWSELPRTPYYTGTAPDGYWEIYWTPDVSLEPGTFEFQCRFENSEGEFSDYVEGTVDISILNNAPQVQDLVVPSSAYRLETIYILADGIDTDDMEGELDPVFEYKIPDGYFITQGDSSSYFRNSPQYIDGKWQIEFLAPYDAPLGEYSFRVKFSDGIDETDWFTASDSLTLSANTEDPDGDGSLNDQDLDDDGDGIPDYEDDFPYDPAASADSDGDGDPDDWNSGETASDSTTGLILDNDDDNDGILDEDDAFPLDPAASVDTDSDGKPDSWNRGRDADDSTTDLVLDDDDDDDGVPDDDDVFPLDPGEDTDTDGDGIGNNVDDDDDGDGVLDVKDPDPLDPDITGKGGPPWYLWVILALIAMVVVVVVIMMWMVMGKKKGK